MKKAKIFYFSLQDEQMKAEKLDWFAATKFPQIPFDHITPDKKGNWINLTDNDFDSFLPLVDKDVKAGKSQTAIFKLFTRGVETGRDEWLFDRSIHNLENKCRFFVKIYKESISTKQVNLEIKWNSSLKESLYQGLDVQFVQSKIVVAAYRLYSKMYFYADNFFCHRLTRSHRDMFGDSLIQNNVIISVTNHTQVPFLVQAVNCLPEVGLGSRTGQCLPLCRYDKNGNRIDNITDWGLSQFQIHYHDTTITKIDIFHYTYAVLHHPTYRQKYELNLKRDFPRLPFYPDFHKWTQWGKTLMELHLNYETIEPYKLIRKEIASKDKPKAKLKADKENGRIILDENTHLSGIPEITWEYKLGNRCALEWILDQYKEKKPKDPTIAKLFNTYRFADYKEQVIDLLQRVCTVSVQTMDIIQQMMGL